MSYVKKFPRCARQFVKYSLRKLMKNQWCMLKIFRAARANLLRISWECSFSGGDAWENRQFQRRKQRLQGCKNFQRVIREKIASLRVFYRTKQRLQRYKNFEISFWFKARRQGFAFLLCALLLFSKRSSACYSLARASFSSDSPISKATKQKGKVLRFCFFD